MLGIRKSFIVTGFSVIAACTMLSACKNSRIVTLDGSHGAIAACEEAVKEQMVSPSSYKRIWAGYSSTPAMNAKDLEAARKIQSDQACPDCAPEVNAFYGSLMDRNKYPPEMRATVDRILADGVKWRKETDAKAKRNAPQDRTARVTIEYDAQNNFGAMLRKFVSCRFDAIDTDGRYNRSDVLFTSEASETMARLSEGQNDYEE